MTLSLCSYFYLETFCFWFVVIACWRFWTHLFLQFVAMHWTATFKVRPLDPPQRTFNITGKSHSLTPLTISRPRFKTRTLWGVWNSEFHRILDVTWVVDCLALQKFATQRLWGPFLLTSPGTRNSNLWTLYPQSSTSIPEEFKPGEWHGIQFHFTPHIQ